MPELKPALYLVATPIGHLDDLSARARQVLAQADLVCAEDTRHYRHLLQAAQIQPGAQRLLSVHAHNEAAQTDAVLQALGLGQRVAVVTDAGTPGISDPAYLLVKACIQAGIAVECLPGATAFVPALVNSGLPIHRFVFEGFLPLKKGRHTLLTRLATEERTMVFYESPHRLVKTLAQLAEYFGADRPCCVSRELTKRFEENRRGTLKEVHDHFMKEGVKGEIVVVVAGTDMRTERTEE